MSAPDTGFVLLGDLVASHKAPDRRALAARIDELLEEIARRFASQWLAPLVRVKGLDEISGVLHHPAPAFDAAVHLNRGLGRARFRFALASGSLDLAPAGGPAAAMDGPAFHRAAAAIERGRRCGLPFAVDLPQREDPAGTALVESLATLYGALTRLWTPAQARTVMKYLALGTQERTARALGVTQQAVSDALRKARLRELTAAEDAIRTWLACC